MKSQSGEICRGRSLIIHETGPAAYPYSVVRTELVERKILELDAADKNMSAVRCAFVDHVGCGEEIIQRLRSGFRRAENLSAPLSKDFRPVALSAKANFLDSKQNGSFVQVEECSRKNRRH